MGKMEIIWKIGKEGTWEKLEKRGEMGKIGLTIYFEETEY